MNKGSLATWAHRYDANGGPKGPKASPPKKPLFAPKPPDERPAVPPSLAGKVLPPKPEPPKSDNNYQPDDPWGVKAMRAEPAAKSVVPAPPGAPAAPGWGHAPPGAPKAPPTGAQAQQPGAPAVPGAAPPPAAPPGPRPPANVTSAQLGLQPAQLQELQGLAAHYPQGGSPPPPSFVVDATKWAEAIKAVQPFWAGYPEPWAVVVAKLKELGG